LNKCIIGMGTTQWSKGDLPIVIAHAPYSGKSLKLGLTSNQALEVVGVLEEHFQMLSGPGETTCFLARALQLWLGWQAPILNQDTPWPNRNTKGVPKITTRADEEPFEITWKLLESSVESAELKSISHVTKRRK
jgi:hypothetical protein